MAFLDNTTPSLRLAALGFGIACAGGVLAFSIDFGPGEPLSFVALGLAALGVGLGFLAIAWGWVSVGLAVLRRFGRSLPPS